MVDKDPFYIESGGENIDNTGTLMYNSVSGLTL